MMSRYGVGTIQGRPARDYCRKIMPKIIWHSLDFYTKEESISGQFHGAMFCGQKFRGIINNVDR
jgi:hypothetical protein